MFSMHKFIETEKIYLDSNIILRYFKNSIRKKSIPFILKVLSSNFKVFISSWVLAEVFEVMQKEFNLSQNKIIQIYKKFLNDFKVEVIDELKVDSSIVKLVRNFGLEAKDALHLFISKKRNLALLTTDKKLVEKGFLSYPNIITPEELVLEYSNFLRIPKT
jgi:predicted nucleic acid-binding protein